MHPETGQILAVFADTYVTEVASFKKSIFQ